MADDGKRSLRIASFLTGSALAFGFAHWLGVLDLSAHPSRGRSHSSSRTALAPKPPEPPKAKPAAVPHTDARDDERARIEGLLARAKADPTNESIRVELSGAILLAASALGDARAKESIEKCTRDGESSAERGQAIARFERCAQLLRAAH